MKLWLLNSYVAAKLQWMLTIYNFPLTFVNELEKMCTRVARSATISTGRASALSHMRHGWQLNSIATMFQRLHVTRRTISFRGEWLDPQASRPDAHHGENDQVPQPGEDAADRR